MEIDYSPFLHVLEDGSIWWRLDDAIKLGAGYLPIRDDERNLIPVLRAKNNRVRANERTLLSEFSQDHYTEAHPRLSVRDDGRYVEAHEFLKWLSQYVAQSQATIPFPNDLARAVKDTAGAPVEHSMVPPSFESLTAALEGWFDKPKDGLPDKQRHRVEVDFFPMPWDDLSPERRRSVAAQWDYQHDPAMESDRQYWWDFYIRMSVIETQIAQWEAVATPTAGDLTLKETRLAECRQELARMEHQQRQARGDYYPERKRLDDEGAASSTTRDSLGPYIAYPKALKMLFERLGAIPEEMAAWVMVGPKDGGLAAYLNANELDPPPRFCYGFGYGSTDDFDYLSPLMACWFREDDIARFEPVHRDITGKALIERWSKQPGIQPEAFIRAKIAESRLTDRHPICGLTQGTNPQNPSSPPLTSALFMLSEVKDIEAEDFSTVQDDSNSKEKVTSPEIGSTEWRRQNAQKAANTRHDQPGGSRDKQRQIKEIWASGKYSSRDICAEQECAALGMSFTAARNALKNTPDP